MYRRCGPAAATAQVSVTQHSSFGEIVILLQSLHVYHPQARFMSSGGGRKGFLGEFVDNLKQELNKNKEMKENIKKFREEAKKLEESDALKQARRKYVRFHVYRDSNIAKRLILYCETVFLWVFSRKPSSLKQLKPLRC